MPRLRAARHANQFQKPNDPARAIAARGKQALRRELKQAFRHLRTVVATDAIAAQIKRGDTKGAVAAVDHWQEVLKGVFNQLGEIRFAAADVGAKQITTAFRKRGRPIRYRRRKDFNPDEPRDEHGQWTSGGSSSSTGTTKPQTVTLGGKEIEVELSGVARALGEKLVMVDAAAFDAAFRRETGFYVGRGGAGGISNRYDRFREYAATHDRVEASSVGVQADGTVGFDNGRHRYAVMRDSGMRAIPVGMDAESIRNARRHGYLITQKAVGDDFDFDRFDEDTLDALRQSQDDLIAELGEQARDTIAYLIDRGVQAGDSADEIAAAIRDTISLTERQAQAVTNYRLALEELDQSALDRALRNEEFDAEVQDAIDSGEFLSDSLIERLTQDYADNYLDYRADTIAQTESLRAANEGLRESYRQAADRGVFPAEAVTRHWKAAIDERTCPICMSISENNEDGVGLNEDFQSDDGPVDDAPVHPSCRCTIEYVTNLDMLPDSEDEDVSAA